MCIACVFLLRKARYYRRTQKAFLIRKMILIKSSFQKSFFFMWIYTKYTTHFSVRLFASAARLVPLEPNRARKCRPGKASADSSSDFRLERTEMDMITFRYSRKIANLRKFKGFTFPLATKFPSSKYIFEYLIISVSICLAEPHP